MPTARAIALEPLEVESATCTGCARPATRVKSYRVTATAPSGWQIERFDVTHGSVRELVVAPNGGIASAVIVPTGTAARREQVTGVFTQVDGLVPAVSVGVAFDDYDAHATLDCAPRSCAEASPSPSPSAPRRPEALLLGGDLALAPFHFDTRWPATLNGTLITTRPRLARDPRVTPTVTCTTGSGTTNPQRDGGISFVYTPRPRESLRLTSGTHDCRVLMTFKEAGSTRVLEGHLRFRLDARGVMTLLSRRVPLTGATP